MTSVYDFEARAIDGATRSLAEYAGKVLLIVNVAGKCGFTPQYAGLEALWRALREKGLVVLGFPCNQFAGQEPAAEAEIAQFCSATYNVTFPLFAKIEVNGAAAHPLFRFLKKTAPGLLGSAAIKWNFTKFLVDRAGTPVRRYAPFATPASLTADIEAALAARA
ncbi:MULTISPECIES: glutathione peroxidase [Methylosinus]|uniref:Glutathione peroxidase n=1 Tax=Methylosinus trichosporium (strain ATCC 35070 / NCIMB 11131 / UNIQEM 75 / OB3b) TaxID=595536 RepID=A0A2D2CXR3_METT3|nr:MULTISPECIES: glutathione peroxidase [Methylosinus]ATQ67496.1 glutathione peroxidase [Methylosinus trichosporium OB3b]OBS51467.1 glutathione peroxidase [Methylosinus sp. 3S-1]